MSKLFHFVFLSILTIIFEFGCTKEKTAPPVVKSSNVPIISKKDTNILRRLVAVSKATYCGGSLSDQPFCPCTQNMLKTIHSSGNNPDLPSIPTELIFYKDGSLQFDDSLNMTNYQYVSYGKCKYQIVKDSLFLFKITTTSFVDNTHPDFTIYQNFASFQMINSGTGTCIIKSPMYWKEEICSNDYDGRGSQCTFK